MSYSGTEFNIVGLSSDWNLLFWVISIFLIEALFHLQDNLSEEHFQHFALVQQTR